jgi:hypothetical protein
VSTKANCPYGIVPLCPSSDHTDPLKIYSVLEYSPPAVPSTDITFPDSAVTTSSIIC